MNASFAFRSATTRRARHRGPWCIRAALAVSAALASVPAAAVPAYAFGPDTHTDITTRALSGFQKVSLAAMAAHKIDNTHWGAIQISDHIHAEQTRYHCDDADYLATSSYPRTRQQATNELLACVETAIVGFDKAVAAADRLVDAGGHIKPAEVALGHPCTYDDRRGRAKCEVFEHLGHAWHVVEDFYAHSNWSDEADPKHGIGLGNPPGLRQRKPAPFFTLRTYSHQATAAWKKDAAVAVDPKLTTGCVPGEYESDGKKADCKGRINHYDSAGQKGLSKEVSRGNVGDNLNQAVKVAVADIERQWQDFRDELLAKYPGRGKKMICALTHDTPTDSTCG
ncbi:CinY protein [Embleya sp. NPDC059237]|uniref:CinY protein n=1 Tax=Embleya sp. NPDC059237 TaxID=3346784 RepID=UPI0036942518